MEAGVHTLSFLAVLCRIESGDSCRKVAKSLGMAYSTVWRAAKALEDQGLIGIVEVPHPGGSGTRLMLTLSEKGQALLDDLTSIFQLKTTP